MRLHHEKHFSQNAEVKHTCIRSFVRFVGFCTEISTTNRLSLSLSLSLLKHYSKFEHTVSYSCTHELNTLVAGTSIYYYVKVIIYEMSLWLMCCWFPISLMPLKFPLVSLNSVDYSFARKFLAQGFATNER